jgi:hypothetical protein
MADGFGSKPQFDTAEFKPATSGDACSFCNASVSSGGYYRLNGKMACASCAQKVQAIMPVDEHAKLVRAVLFGIGGAVVGLALYAGVEIMTGWTIGYLALAVSFIVAKAMMMGSGGIGGRRYQVVALLLTYAAISMAFVPFALSMKYKEEKAARAAQNSTGIPASDTTLQGSQSPSQTTPSTTTNAPPATKEDAQSTDTDSDSPKPISRGKAILVLVGIGLASPFLELTGISGIIGLVILYVGMQIAWRLAAGAPRVKIEGPY